MKITSALLVLCLALPCAAQQATDGPPQRGGEPQVKRVVIEDDLVRVDELRVRGITRKLTVQSKLLGAPAYRIDSTGDTRDASPDRRSEGRALWQLLAF
jgi:hypothetical protein